MPKYKNHKPKNRRRKPGRTERKERHGGNFHSGALPEIGVVVISDITDDGELIAEPFKWDSKRKPPHIVVTETGRGQIAAKGDKVLVKLRKINPNLYQGLLIRILPGEQARPVMGLFVSTADGGIIEPISRKNKESFMVAHADVNGAHHGDLVTAMTLPGTPSLSMGYAKITERLGRMDSPRAASLIASHMHNLPSVFSDAAIAESEAAEPPVMQAGRVDLRDIPLVTIDGEDARDFDDAVFAERDGSGWHLVVAIADVAYYVKDGSALDTEALERGNSVYFPDRVIPMLPERLSNGLCSLMPEQDRYCLAVHIWIDENGAMKRYEFVRGLMRSRARLTYEWVEGFRIQDSGFRGENMILPESRILNPESLIANLYGAYAALATERDQRGALNLNLPEFKIQFDSVGNVAAIAPKAQLESHRLIESFMIAANVAAADFLLKKKIPGIYRVHETPNEEKLDDLRTLLKMAGYSLHVGAGVKAAHFNRVLKQAEGRPDAYLVNSSVLRSQMQAYYAHENLGHFGLSLQKYCHFTSPIRRYADLIVHRSLVAAIDHKKEKPSAARLPEIALHISETERRAMLAERDASDRYKVSYMSRHVGNTFSGTIVSLNEYGLFVGLTDTGITGFIPVRNLEGDFYHYDKRHSSFRGQRSKHEFKIGDMLMIRVQTANAITGSLIFELAQSPTPPDRPLRPQFQKQQKRRHHEHPSKDGAGKPKHKRKRR